jgi:hypothetical protein
MKTIQITRREQHVLMTVVRVILDGLQISAPTRVDRTVLLQSLERQPGINSSTTGTDSIPTIPELDSILERLSSNDEG